MLKISYYENLLNSIEFLLWYQDYFKTEILIFLREYLSILFKFITSCERRVNLLNLFWNCSLPLPIHSRHDSFKIDYSLICHHLISIHSLLFDSCHIFAHFVQSTDKLNQVIKNHVAKIVGFFFQQFNGNWTLS